MPLLYPIKRVFRSWKLFLALLIGIILATTFLASLNIKANIAAEDALNQQLASVITDLEFEASINVTNLAYAYGNISLIEGVKDVDFLTRQSGPMSVSTEDYNISQRVPIASMPNSSRIYDEWVNKPEEWIQENETYVVAGSRLSKKIAVGDNITTVIDFWTPKRDNVTTVYLNLTVAGFADLTDTGYALITGNTRNYGYQIYILDSRYGYSDYRNDLLIISWENTLEKLWVNAPNGTVSTTFSINIDRDELLNPWDTATSAQNVQRVADQIQNNILANFEAHGSVINMLGNELTNFQSNFSYTLFSLIVVSLPVFFVAWYLGSTVSDVSFNTRRREIGLLSTKGLSSGQIQRMFLTEALTIGLIGGIIGVFGGVILNQVLSGGFNLDTLLSPRMLNPYTIIFTIAFGMILSVSSVFLSARRAAKLPAVEALRDYLQIDSIKAYRKRWPWVAFILGTYKIVIYLTGINAVQLAQAARFQLGSNFFVELGIAIFAGLDTVLNYVGPLLFFWGITKLLIQNSLKFQQLTAKISVVMGDLGALAAKNVRRSPARLAAVAFLIAFIIGYGVQVTGQLASEQDYAVREVQSQAIADITVSVVNASLATNVTENILANVTGVRNATIQYTLSQNSAGTVVKTIDPDTWAATAYYEEDWFSGASREEAFNALKADNMTIILERRIAKQYDMQIGDTIGIDFPSGPRKLRIVGFFGPEPTDSGGSIYLSRYWYAPQMWSFAPKDLFNMSSVYSDAYQLEDFETTILLRLNEGANSTKVREDIRGLDLDIYGMNSFEEQWQKSLQGENLSTFSSLQTAETQRLGLIFVVLAASVGTALISVVSLKERTREATIMSVRGLSYKQLVWMFLTENIAVITFSVVLGVSVGLIIVYGNVTSTNTSSVIITELVKRRVIFSTDFIVSVAAYIATIYAAAVAAIIVMTRQYVTKLERMIRTR